MQRAMVLNVRGSFVGMLVATAACGGGSDSGSSPDAATVQGSWRVTSPASVDGALVLGGSDIALATAQPPSGILSTYTVSGTSLVTGGQSIPFTFGAGPTLTLQLSAGTVALAPDTATPPDTFSVKGSVTAPTSTPTYAHPRMLLAFLDHSDAGFVFEDPRYYQDLSFTNGTATFDLELDRAAIGTGRITFGTADIEIAYLVIFDDKDGDGMLTDLFDACTESSVDCVLGMSPVVLTFRFRSSPELAASPYAYVRDGGWCQAVFATDARGGGTKLGLVALDAGKTLDFDVALAQPPAAIPRLDLTVPTVN